MKPNIDTLPTELYTCIFSHLQSSNSSYPDAQTRSTMLALSRAIPRSPVPTEDLFRGDLVLKRREQVVELDARLRRSLPAEEQDIKEMLDSLSLSPQQAVFNPTLVLTSLSLHPWDADAEVLTNLLRRLKNLEVLRIRIGPMNFTPGVLKGLVDELGQEKKKLKKLELRFKPYVEKATYLPFLAGSYFEGTLVSLSAWPVGVPIFSIVQDPDRTGIKTFAQPIVFHLLDQPLSLLIHSRPFVEKLKHLRLRIPGRSVISPLTKVFAVNQTDDPTHGTSIPLLKTLDLSTSLIREPDVDVIISRFMSTLDNLIVDDCTGLIRHNAGPAMGEEWVWWSGVGKRWVTVGVKKARDKEKEVKSALESIWENRRREREQGGKEAEAQVAEGSQSAQGRKARQGRRGLATATITIRGANALSEAGHEIKLPAGLEDFEGPIPKISVIPPFPKLKKIALHSNKATAEEDRKRIIREFENGWEDGLRTIWARRERMLTTFRREKDGNSRFYKFGDGDELVPVLDENDEVFVGLDVEVPRICLGGEAEGGHEDGCAHSVASRLWESLT